MSTLYYYIMLALTKVVDNLITTEKTILIQKNKALAASILVAIAEFMFFFIIKNVVSDGNTASMIIVSIAAGIGSYIAFCINKRWSKDTVFINIVTSNDRDKMMAFGDHMRAEGIKVFTMPAYGDGIEKTLSALVFANTRAQSKKIDQYMEANEGFFREVVN